MYIFIILILLILHIIPVFSSSQQKQEYQAFDRLIEITSIINKSGNHISSERNIIDKVDQIASADITESYDYSFDDYIAKINQQIGNKTFTSPLNKLNNDNSRVIFNEFSFRTIAAVQHNLERIYWNMEGMEQYKSSVVNATVNKELSQIKTELLNKQFELLSSKDDELKIRTWQAIARMLNETDVQMSETGNEFVQRSPYGIMIRKGELTNKLKQLSANENDSEVKAYAQQIVQTVLTAGQKYKDPGRQIVIGAGPEITGLINREALLYFNAAMEREDHLQKIGYYTKAIELDTNFAAAYFNRAVSSFELKNYKEATKDFKQVLRIDPKETDVFPRLGDCYLKTEQYNSAIENYTKALEEEHPERSAILVNRGIAYQKKHEYESAVKDFTDAIELDSISVSAYNNRAQSLVALKDYNKAIDDYEMLIKLRPQNSTYYFNLGCIYWEHKNWQKVNEVWQKGLAVNPNDQNILKNLPEIKSRLSNP